MTDEPETNDRAGALQALQRELSDFMDQLRRAMDAMAKEVDPRLNPGSLRAFSTLVRMGPTNLSGLANLLQQDKGQLSRSVRDLEDYGLIERRPDPDDGRSSLLVPTESGRAALDRARRSKKLAMSAILDEWEITDIRELTRLLRALTADTVASGATAAPAS